MTIEETLEDVCASLSVQTTFMPVSSLNEANWLADALLTAQYPLCLVLPVIVTDAPGKSGILKSKFPLAVYFLNKSTEITTDFKSSEIAPYIKTMRDLAREFIHKLNETDLIDPETDGIGERSYEPEYGLLDAHLFGVLCRASVPVMEGVTGCVP